jgi:hypothetical protein
MKDKWPKWTEEIFPELDPEDDNLVLTGTTEIAPEIFEAMTADERKWWTAFFLKYGTEFNETAKEIFRREVCGLVLPKDLEEKL